MKDSIITIYLVRHGETDWNVAGKLQGQTDIPLNENGKLQAKNLASSLKHIHFDAIYSSDLLRAKNTAEIVVQNYTLAVNTTEFIRERGFGHLEGEKYHMWQIFRTFYETLSKEKKQSYKQKSGFESAEEVIKRIMHFFKTVVHKHQNQTILVVTHGGIMKELLLYLQFVTSEQVRGAVIANTAYIILKTNGTFFCIEKTEGVKLNKI